MRATSHRGGADRPITVLFTEGSSSSARQSLFALGRCGYTIDICDPQRLCLARFSRFVRTQYRCPPFGSDPGGYLAFLVQLLRSQRYDVLFPVHDQVFLLARFRDQLAALTGLAVPGFQSVERLQSKAAFVRLLDRLDLPHPRTEIVKTQGELERACRFPCYLKLAYSTAGCGVWLVHNEQQRRSVVDRLVSLGLLDGRSELLVQEPAGGVFCVSQVLFEHGRLVAAHSYQARAIGVGGSAQARLGVWHPAVQDDVRRLGQHLNWHGAMHVEYFYDPATGRRQYIEANPRIGETMNATLSGVNLCHLLVLLSMGQRAEAAAPPRPGVRTHALMTGLLAVAERDGTQRALLREIWQAWTGRKVYRGSQDELTRPGEDLRSLIPLAALAAQLLIRPSRASRIVRRAVDNYSMSEATAERIRALPADLVQRLLSASGRRAGEGGPEAVGRVGGPARRV